VVPKWMYECIARTACTVAVDLTKSGRVKSFNIVSEENILKMCLSLCVIALFNSKKNKIISY